MRLITRHLTIGLIYKRVWRLLPAGPGTVISLFWQLVNLYGSLPAGFFMVFVFFLFTGLVSLMMLPLTLFPCPFSLIYGLAAGLVAGLFLLWAGLTIRLNLKGRFQLFNVYFSTRTALILLGFLLGLEVPALKLSAKTTFWELHLKPTLAGNLNYRKNRAQFRAAIKADYQGLQKLIGPDAILFGCSPGSFKFFFRQAGIDPTQVFTQETLIPPSHARVFGLKQPFNLHIVSLGPHLCDAENRPH